MKRSCKLVLFLTFFQVVSGSVQVPALFEGEARKHNFIFEQPCFDEKASELEKKTRKIRAAIKPLIVLLPAIPPSQKRENSSHAKRAKRKYPAQKQKELEGHSAYLEQLGNELKKEKTALEKEKSDLLFSCLLKQVVDNTESFTGLEENEWGGWTLFADDPNLLEQLKQAEEV